MENRFVTIASFYMPHEAEMAASFLEEQGIPTVIRDDNTNPMGGGYVEIRLQVPEQNADDALEILDRMMDEGIDLLEDIEEGYETEATEETASNWKDIPTDTKPVICPRCLSINSHKILPGPVPAWLNALLLGLPGLFFPAKLQCRGCGAVFK
jgi:DNA-directed RNA polymerase subunit L